jgi:predicted amino acid racemase
MFLDTLMRRNAQFLESVIALHQRAAIPANSYVLDLDAVATNARTMADEAARHGLDILAMTKQVGRAPGFLAAARSGGIGAGVAVDMTDGRALVRGGLQVGHIGHLVQVPRAEATAAVALDPLLWTVFSDDKAGEAATAAREAGRTQNLLARIYAPGDTFYRGHEGGFPSEDVISVAERLDRLDGARFAGVTTFPALLFDPDKGDVVATPNLLTLQRAVERLHAAGFANLVVNAPGTTSSATLGLLAAYGATQVEPGHGLTGTTPLHLARDLPELPALCYLTEVSHSYAGKAYAYGGGFYIDPVLGSYPVRAVVADGAGLADARVLDAATPPPEAIDYYATLDPGGNPLPPTGATVLFGFRAQAFVTRAYTAGITGASTGHPVVTGIWTSTGEEARWPR